MEYIQLFKKLEEQKIRYLVCGGLAVNIYGIPRMTADIDILLDFTDVNLENFENAIKQLKYQSMIPLSIRTFVTKKEREKAIAEKNLIAYSYFNTMANYMSLDVLIDVPFHFDEMWAEKEERSIDGTTANIVSINHLIEMKKYSNRKQDVDDVILLSKLAKK